MNIEKKIKLIKQLEEEIVMLKDRISTAMNVIKVNESILNQLNGEVKRG
mgnify:CR=1 FL=1|tara:strand:- start:1098 stop:1244 length:147 start_codon:yes stop_codon:yes gene_type:complete